MSKGPVLIKLDRDVSAVADVNTAPPLPDPVAPFADGWAMQVAAKVIARKPSFLGRLFWSVTLTFLGAMVSIAARGLRCWRGRKMADLWSDHQWFSGFIRTHLSYYGFA